MNASIINRRNDPQRTSTQKDLIIQHGEYAVLPSHRPDVHVRQYDWEVRQRPLLNETRYSGFRYHNNRDMVRLAHAIASTGDSI
jgi:hypothetical protein